MKFLADENIDQPVVEKLRSRGLDVSAVEEEAKGAEDREVLQKAIREERILVTFDDDFSDLEKTHPGVIRITSVAEYGLIVSLVVDLADSFSKQDFENTVVEVSPSDYR